ncbi:hypothetical protein F4810DRAFT_661788 [Camillea tinctor]|nr:hypothetical protein F4810DRAFT_661788 [Camillea tinctor]
MDGVAIEEAGTAGIPDIVNQIATLFPIEDADYTSNATLATEDEDGFVEALVYLSSIGVPVLVSLSTSADPQDTDVVIPVVTPNADLAEASTGLNASSLAALIAPFLPSEAAQSAAEPLAQGVLDILAEASAALEPIDFSDNNELFYSTTIGNVTEAAPELFIDRTIQRLAPPDYQIDRIRLIGRDFFPNISSVMTETPKATLQALMIALALTKYQPYTAVSANPTADRWASTCSAYLQTEGLNWIANKFWLDVSYSDEVREYVDNLTVELRDSFDARLDTVAWMDDETRKIAKEKLAQIARNIGYPDSNPEARNATALKEYYADVNITSSHFDNALSLNTATERRNWQALSAPFDRRGWDSPSFIANAFYRPQSNDISIFAGISQDPLLWLDSSSAPNSSSETIAPATSVPSYLTYGGFGLITGHEFTHGFDNSGSQFDARGAFVGRLFTAGAQAAFEARQSCFVAQYSGMALVDERGRALSSGPPGFDPAAYEEAGQPLFVDGERTLGENLADAGGIAIAFDAWQRSASGNVSLLPGVPADLTPERLFFVAAAQSFCQKYTPAQMLPLVQSDVHSPGFARVNGIAANSRAFRQAFDCPVKEPTCEIW